MDITPNVSLSNYSTMRIGGIAQHLTKVRSRDELREACRWAKERSLPVIVVGSGSNIVWQDSGFSGLIIVNGLLGYHDEQMSDTEHLITVAAGEPWDSVVARTVDAGLTGIEALSLIPGTAGATPVQNVGAYGQEIADTLVNVDVYDVETDDFTSIAAEDCGFAYRKSKFQNEFRGRYYIVAIKLKLTLGNPLPPYYGAVQQYLEARSVTEPITPTVMRDAVIAIRSAKLPDVEAVANNGSFFGNPVVDDDKLAKLLQEYPDMPNWPLPNGGAKVPAAWLLERAGFKDYHDEATGMATWHNQPLVLVNEHAKSTADLLEFKQKIVETVETKFGITLHQEPELLP